MLHFGHFAVVVEVYPFLNLADIIALQFGHISVREYSVCSPDAGESSSEADLPNTISVSEAGLSFKELSPAFAAMQKETPKTIKQKSFFIMM